MAEGWLRHLAGNEFAASSAGTHPVGVHPFTLHVMLETGVDLAGATSKSVSSMPGPFDYIVTTCAEAQADCPNLRGSRGTAHWHIPDPVARAHGVSEREGLDTFRRARDLIRKRVVDLLEDIRGGTL